MDIYSLLAAPESKTLEFKRSLSSSKSILKSLEAFANTAGGVLIIGKKAGAWLGRFYGILLTRSPVERQNMDMAEHQTSEYKQIWKDEYLKWVCGFANAQGGKLYIGKNDRGEVTGLANAERLLEEIPNKVRDMLGIMVDVNLLHEADPNGQERDYLEITVEPYPSPISYKGQYHYRSGSTKQELKGAALDAFLLKKHGLHWDGVPVPGFSVEDCSATAFSLFKTRAANSRRVDEHVLNDSQAVASAWPCFADIEEGCHC